MKKTIILIIVIIVGILVYMLSKSSASNRTAVDPNREQQCRDFLAVALFPDAAAADAFLERCMRGEPVLPEEQVNE